MEEEYRFPPIDKTSYKPLYIQVSEMIIDYAGQQELKPNDPLPSENVLLSKLDVSRNTIRLAVDRLVKMDFAVKIRGQGTFIKEKKAGRIKLDLRSGLEPVLKDLGVSVENDFFEKRIQKDNFVNWRHGLNTVKSDRTVLIRRRKLAAGKILAIEERVLPEHVVCRFSEPQLKHENIYPTLLERYPDTTAKKLTYHFVPYHPTSDESDLLECRPETPTIVRIGEYLNQQKECFMLSRFIFNVPEKGLTYDYEREDGIWRLA